MQAQRTLACVVSRGDGEVRTMDIDRVRLCTGDVGADEIATSSPFFLAVSIPSRVGTVGLCGRGVVEGHMSGCGVSGEGALVDLRCELELTPFRVVPCRDDPSPCRTDSYLGSMKPTSKGASRQVAAIDDATILTVRLEFRLVRELTVVPILAVTSSKGRTKLSWTSLRMSLGLGARGTHSALPSSRHPRSHATLLDSNPSLDSCRICRVASKVVLRRSE
jgi:hypothetical protein